MALQVWLPLTGHLENQGLDGEAVVQNAGATVNTNGKIGPCYAFDGTQKITVTSTYLQNYLCSPSAVFSMTCWIYLNSDETDRVIIFGNFNSNPFINWELTAACKMRLCAGGTSNYITGTDTAVVPKTTWTHLAVTYDGNKIEFYVNGEKTNTTVVTNTITGALQHSMFYLGGDYRNDATRLKGRMNDFRFYDNVLSAKEIEMLSRGLVLHYPLAPPGGENILLNGSFSKDYTNWASSGHTITTEDDYLCGHVSGALSTTRKISQSIYNAIKDDDYTTQIYTISADIKLVNYVAGTTNPYVALYFSGTYDNNGTNAWLGATRVGGTLKSLPGFNNQGWVRVTYIVRFEHKPIGMTFYVYCRDCTGDLYYRNIKMEKGSVATPWCPNSADGEYTALGFNDGIEYDVSGFKNNGTKYGNLNWSSDTPRYNACYEFDGTGDYIRLKQDEYDRFRLARDELTVNIWAYKEDWSDYTDSGITSQWNTFFSCAEGGGWVLYERGNGIIHYSVGTGSTTNAYKSKDTATGYAGTLSAGWHMFTMTYDGLTLLGYIDGELVTNTTAAYTEKTPIFYKNGTASVYVGTECGASTGGYYWTGKLSDFRIYETALSSADILELYQTGASLASNGTLMTSEYVESI